MRSNEGRAVRGVGLALVVALLMASAVTGCSPVLQQDDGDAGLEHSSPGCGVDAAPDATPVPDAATDATANDAGVDAADAQDAYANIDFSTNKDHCGRPNHSCLGGDCVAGKCQPVLIAPNQNELNGLSLTETELCWSFYPLGGTDVSGLRCVDRMHGSCDGAECRTVTTTPKYANPIYADGRFYWSNLYPHYQSDIMTIASTGGTESVFVQSQLWPSDMVIAGGYLYWANREGLNTINRVRLASQASPPPDGGYTLPETLATWSKTDQVEHLALTVDADGTVYWSDFDTDKIYRQRPGDPQCHDEDCLWLRTRRAGPGVIVADKDYIYIASNGVLWDYETDGAVVRVKRDCNSWECIEPFLSDRAGPGILADDHDIYFTDMEGAGDVGNSVIRKAANKQPCTGDACELLFSAPGTAGVSAIIMDDAALYFVLHRSDVYRLAK